MILSVYDETHAAGSIMLSTDAGGIVGNSRAGDAVPLNACTITSIKLYLKKSGGTLTGNGHIDIKACTGTPKTDGLPTGSVLASSDNYAMSGLTGSYQLIEFTFSSPYIWAGGDMTFELNYTCPTNSVMDVAGDTTGTIPGNGFWYDGSYHKWTNNCCTYYIYGDFAASFPYKSKGIRPSAEPVAIYDSLHKPYMNKEGYLAYTGEITKDYVENLGYVYRDADYKQPYLHDDYHRMMYLFTADPVVTGQSFEGNRINYGGDMPRADDQFFDNAPQVASLANFNSYARANYLMMGKSEPTAKAIAEFSIKNPSPPILHTTEYIISNPTDPYYVGLGATISFSVGSPIYAPEKYTWVLVEPAYYVLNHFQTYYYNYSIGTLSPVSGYNATFTAITSWQGGWSWGGAHFIVKLFLAGDKLCGTKVCGVSG